MSADESNSLLLQRAFHWWALFCEGGENFGKFLSVWFISFYFILSNLSTDCKRKLSEDSVSNDGNSNEICFQRKTQIRGRQKLNQRLTLWPIQSNVIPLQFHCLLFCLLSSFAYQYEYLTTIGSFSLLAGISWLSLD